MKRLILLAFLSLPLFAQSYSAILTGAGAGAGFAVVTIDGVTLRYSVFVQNIGSPIAAHIQTGNGNVV
ncbi:MAG TPA: hypothetical protein VKB93_18215, partial [Thermoanaerobaculia bacterium]|nr:hypothetical protein [Thermoanaerobaculia bacterium]